MLLWWKMSKVEVNVFSIESVLSICKSRAQKVRRRAQTFAIQRGTLNVRAQPYHYPTPTFHLTFLPNLYHSHQYGRSMSDLYQPARLQGVIEYGLGVSTAVEYTHEERRSDRSDALPS